MPRVLSPEHKAKLAAGRKAAAERRAAEQIPLEDAAYRNYMDWVKLEADEYRRLISIRAIYGDASIEAQGAYDNWLATWSIMPTAPAKEVFKRNRGEVDDEAEGAEDAADED